MSTSILSNPYTVIRLIKIILLFSFGFFVFLATFGNITDYQSNYMFVKHVLSMDATFPGNELMYRAITSSSIHHTVYISIIIVEALTSFLCTLGGWRLWKAIKLSQSEFHQAKSMGMIGLGLGLCIWYIGFQVIGGEWFAMWQSKVWNGLDPAMRVTTYLLGALIFISLNNDGSKNDLSS